MNEVFSSPPKIRRVIQVSPCVDDGKVHAEHIGPSPIPLVRFWANSSHVVPVVSPQKKTIFVDDPVPQVRIKPPQLILPQPSSTQDRQFPSMDHQVPELNIKPEFLHSCGTGHFSSIDLEGKMVDSAIDNVMNLPQAFNEVVEIQKDQTNELQRQQLLQKSYQEKLKEVLEKKEDIEQEITGVTHNIYITDELKRNSAKKCKQYDIEIKDLVTVCEKDRNKMKDLEGEIEQNQRQYNKYREMMRKHKQVVTEFEGDLDIYKEMKDLEEAIAGFENYNYCMGEKNQETEKLFTGQIEKEIHDKMRTTKMCIEELKLTISKKNDLIQQEKSKQSQMQLSLNVLQKKNTAQLTRLKKQVKAAQQSKRQWHDEISQLQKSINELNDKLGQDVK